MPITASTTCNYFNPKVWDGSPPTTKQDTFEYASSTCITNFSNATGSLATMTYGDVLISFFLFIIMLGFVFGFILKFFRK